MAVDNVGTPKVIDKNILNLLPERVRDELSSQDIELLRRGEIPLKIRESGKIKLEDFTNFFRMCSGELRGRLIQEEEVKAAPGSFYAPQLNVVATHDTEAKLSQEDRQILAQSIGAAAGWKATGTDASQGGGTQTGSGAMSEDELEAAARRLIDSWEEFGANAFDMQLGARMTMEMSQKVAEVEAEFRRLWALMKQGLVDPAFVIIAATKVNIAKPGVIISYIGKDMVNQNDSLRRVTEDLTKYGDMASMQKLSNISREKGQNMQMEMMTLQKLVTHIESAISAGSGMAEITDKLDSQLINAFNVR